MISEQDIIKKTVIVWFRHDLRLADNAALSAALQAFDSVIPLFIISPEEDQPWGPGSASKWWLHQSLQALQSDLVKCRSRLVLRMGKNTETLTAVAKEAKASEIFWNRCYEPFALARDRAIEKKLKEEGYGVKTFPGALLYEPWTIRNQQGAPYKVFTPFWKYVTSLEAPSKPLVKPVKLKAPAQWPRSSKLDELNLESRMNWTSGLRKNWRPGELGAVKEWTQFLNGGLLKYAVERNRPDHQGTSRLAPHLHFGEITPRMIWNRIAKKPKAVSYLRQIVWREFAAHLLYHFPDTPEHPLNKKFSTFPWKKNKTLLQAWQKGKTGYPLVDAGMRELWHTGWMHNRVRMIAASFLVKDLLIPWQEGAKWFWDTLVDADLANNTMGWQWVAGCGADAAPFFRIFNPVTQGEKFDPQGNYVRKWVPEISGLPDKWIHKPWMTPANILQAAGIVLGRNYPDPVVDHNHARRIALLAYERIKRK